MYKEFDKWNKRKKEIENYPEIFGVHEREIWWVSFGLNIGVEINGKSEKYERPAIVIRKFNRQMVWVVPITSQVKDKKFYIEFLFGKKTYFACLTQIRTLSTKRFLRKIGMMSDANFIEVMVMVASFLQNETPPKGGESRRPKP